MLPKVNRLRKPQDFAAVYQKGFRRSTPHLILRAKAVRPQASDGPQSPTRIGISVSQKVSKRAVVRNRLKRQVRQACRSLLHRLLPGWDVVIVVRSQALECEPEQFLPELEQLLASIKILNGH